MHALYVHATKQGEGAKRSNASEEDSDQPDRPTKKKKPQNQKEEQKGLGANPGHKQSQNSHFLTLRLATP